MRKELTLFLSGKGNRVVMQVQGQCLWLGGEEADETRARCARFRDRAKERTWREGCRRRELWTFADGPVGCGFSVFGPELNHYSVAHWWAERVSAEIRWLSLRRPAIWLEEPQPPYFVSNFSLYRWLEFTLFQKYALVLRENISACHSISWGFVYSFFNYWLY